LREILLNRNDDSIMTFAIRSKGKSE